MVWPPPPSFKPVADPMDTCTCSSIVINTGFFMSTNVSGGIWAVGRVGYINFWMSFSVLTCTHRQSVIENGGHKWNFYNFSMGKLKNSYSLSNPIEISKILKGTCHPSLPRFRLLYCRCGEFTSNGSLENGSWRNLVNHTHLIAIAADDVIKFNN